MITRYPIIAALIVLLLFVGTAPTVEAQGYTIDIKPVRGFMPTADQINSPIDSVETVSGKLHTSIPLASLPRGRAGNSFDVSLQYDSHLFDILPAIDDFLTGYTTGGAVIEPYPSKYFTLTGSTGGWTYNFANFRLDEEYLVPPEGHNCGDPRAFRYRVALADGSQHVLHLRGYGDEFSDLYRWPKVGYSPVSAAGLGLTYDENGSLCYSTTGRLTYFTTDGSYLKLEIDADGSNWQSKTWYLYFPDGRIVEGSGSQILKIRDANGNAVIFDNTMSGNVPTSTTIYHEEDGAESDRAVIVTYNTASTSTTRTDTVSGPGPNGRITWTINWERIHVGSSSRLFKKSDAPAYDPASLNAEFDWDLWVVTGVQLPLEAASGSPNVWNSYAFGYSGDSTCGFGELKSIRTPSNSTYTYNYALEHASSCSSYVYPTEEIARYNSVVQREVTGTGIQTLTTSYAYDRTTDFKTVVTAPDLGTTTTWFYQEDYSNWKSGLVYRVDEPNGSVRKRVWAQNMAYGVLDAYSYDADNPFVQKETVTIGDDSGDPTKTAVTEYTVDKNGNPLQQTQYAWVSYAGAYDGASSGIESGSTIQRITTNAYWNDAPDSSDTSTNDSKEYWYTHTTSSYPEVQRRLNAARRRDVWVTGANYAASEFEYDDPDTTGNLTTEYRWDNFSDLSHSAPALGYLTSSNSRVLTRHYDSYGNLNQIDAPEVPTSITYDSLGHFPTEVEYDYTGGAHRTWNYAWYTDGSLYTKTDADNGVVTTYTYDTVGRQLTAVDSAASTNLRKTQTAYSDQYRKVTTKHDLAAYNDANLQSITHYDELGRVILTQTSDGSALSSDSDGIKVSTIYSTFSGGNRVVTSTPYRSTSDATLEWSCTQADASGRVTDVGMFTGSSAPSACTSSTSRTGLTHTDYNVEVTTVTDPASKRRDETRDALGRLTSVVEDQSGLNYTTSYAYDPLDNLTGVTQGSQSRTFNYSSLGLLKNATNPESGTIGYTYTAGGDLDTRTDARSVSTTYSYDGLHRVLTKNYSDSTPDVTYAYATSGTCKIGQLASVTTSASTTTYDSYDCLGHVTGSTQTIAANSSNPYSFGYTWGLADNLKTMTYPSGKLVNYDFDDAGRISKVYTSTKTYGDLTTGSGVAYTPSGQLAKIKLGNDLWETRDFHTPGTATKYRLGTTEGAYDRLELEYNFSGTVNNGNVASHVIRNGGSTWTQSFTYDGVNRLSTAAETSGYSQAYGYDQWGNRWVSSGNRGDVHEPTVSTNFSSSTNRLSIQSSTYDSAGNQTFYTPYTLAYDAENRNTSVTSSSNGNASFVYDGDGHRVIKTWTPNGGSATTSYYVYDALGELAAEYSTQSATTGTSWNFTDMLGSVRAVTGEKPTSGNAAITECYDYIPFGQMLGTADNGRSGAGCYPNLSNPISTKLPQKFTGKERDAETGLDFFGARYFSGAQGRFTSPDEPLIDQSPGDPQSWNLYSYVRNNPLNAIDPNGQDCIYINDNSVGLEEGNCSKKGGTYVNGTIDRKSFTYDPSKGTLGYTYSSPGAPVNGGVIEGVYPSTGVSSSDLFNAVARGTQMAAPGVNLAAAGLQAFGYAVAPIPMTLATCLSAGCSKGDVAMAMLPLTPGAMKVLGGIAPLAEKTVADAIRIRGGGGGQVNKVASWLAQKTVAEVAELAAKGNGEAKTAIKIIKDAARLSQK